jgi:ribosomal protein S3AE
MAKSELKKQTKQAIKLKKKKWFLIVSPKTMGEHPIGESYLDEGSLAVGRTVKVNLMQITGDVKSQSVEVKFEISGVKDNKLETRVIGYYFSPATIRRFMRRHMTRVDDAVVATTQDNIKIRIKPFLLTRSKVTKSVDNSLRITVREELINFVRKTPYETIFSMVTKYQLQKELKEKLSKIYPLKNLEIRILEEEKNKLIKETEMPVKKAAKKSKSKTEDNNEEELLEEEHKKEAEESAEESEETEEAEEAEEAEESEDIQEESEKTE